MTDPLQKLFGSTARVKLLRLFLFNPRISFTAGDIIARARVSDKDVRRELALLQSIEVIYKSARGKGMRYALNSDFSYLEQLQNLLLNTVARGEEMAKELRSLGPIKFVVLSGVFVGEWDAHLDILLVGERVNDRKLRERIRRLEADLGRELHYTLLSTPDFLYRLNMNDKLVRDVMDYPHRIVVDKLNIGLK